MTAYDLALASDPTTPPDVLDALLMAFGGQEEHGSDPVAIAAARNPSLLTDTLRDLLLAGKWPSAWANPAADLCLLEHPVKPFRRDLCLMGAAFTLVNVPTPMSEHNPLTADVWRDLQRTLATNLPAHPFADRWRDHLLAAPWPCDWRDRTERTEVNVGDWHAYDTMLGHSSRGKRYHVVDFDQDGVVTLYSGRDNLLVDVSALVASP